MNEPKTRAEIPAAYTWKLEDIFESDEAWEQAFLTAQAETEKVEACRGTLGESPEKLLKAFEFTDGVELMMERLYCYAHMRRDEDNGNAKYQGMTDRAMQLMVAYSAAASFMTPEILAIDPATLKAWMELPELKNYRHSLENIDRARAHVLDESMERLLALASEPLEAPQTIFTMLNNVDIRFGKVTNEKGETLELTHGNFRSFLESPDRAVRKEAFETFYASFEALKNTLAAAYAGSVKGDVFSAGARKHGGALLAALFGTNVPEAVYDGLIEAMHKRMDAMEKYLKLRKKALGVDELHMYDLYVPIVPDMRPEISYEKAQALVLEAMAPLGERYVSLLKRAFDERWIDVYENRGKTSGAFSWGAYGTHPYVLLNFQPELDYAFTIAHELGHALHSFFSDEAQTYANAQYKIMAAEVASTVNEVLLTKHLLKKEKDPAMRAYILNHFLEQFRTTVYRQTMFAEFEKKAHEMCEKGEPLTVESLSALYRGLNEAYYPGVCIDKQIELEWARIPHFYNAFYVYQYATGFSAAVAFAEDILNGAGPEKYLAFLASGGSDYPIELLKRAGVDLTKQESILKALDVFDENIAALAALL